MIHSCPTQLDIWAKLNQNVFISFVTNTVNHGHFLIRNSLMSIVVLITHYCSLDIRMWEKMIRSVNCCTVTIITWIPCNI